MTDRLTPQEFETLRDAAEDNFAALARKHDATVQSSLVLFSLNDREPNASTVAKAMHFSRLADAIKAIMLVRFPEASDDWFGV
jgi:hypothetical protein